MNTRGFRLEAERFGQPSVVLQRRGEDTRTTAGGALVVRMTIAPINPSDLIPVSGAYRHRTVLPFVPGYEGVGVVAAAPAGLECRVGSRVLPLRGEGTWRTHVRCDPFLAVPVPDDVPDALAARAYINPLTALSIMEAYPPHGKRVLITGGGSSCAHLLAYEAARRGAAEVQVIHRAPRHAEALRAAGTAPISESDLPSVKAAAREADLVLDAIGGAFAVYIAELMRAGATLVGYGLMSGEPVHLKQPFRINWRRFHLRDALPTDPTSWHRKMRAVWPLLRSAPLPVAREMPMHAFRDAVAASGQGAKPLLVF